VVLEAEQARVFQIALGGGEPLLHPRLVDMVRLAREHSVVPNLTTNGNLLTREMAHELKEAGLGQTQVSLNGADEAVNAQTRPNFAATMQAIENCQAAGLRWGLNFLVTRSNLTTLEAVIELGRRLGAASVNILRPKPPTTAGDWLARESPDGAGYRAIQKVLHKVTSSKLRSETSSPKPHTRLTLDASLSFLLTDQPPDRLYRNGVWGCCAARKFVTVTQDGAVLPCSHVRRSDIGEGDFMRAWWQSEVFAWFREQEELMRGPCRACSYLELCKGCRAVVMAFGGDFAQSDPHCPLRGNQPQFARVHGTTVSGT
jgi:radical SAM protein with 4Fe4S-binding SPASM domain